MFDTSTLNSAQLEAVTAPDGPVLVIAGAGSGKTRTIIYRLAWLAEQGIPPSSMLLLTFTRKASQEMLHRATMLLNYSLGDVNGGTFHSIAFSTLRQYKPSWATGKVTIIDAQDTLTSLQHCKEELKIAKGDRSFPKLQTVAALLSRARNKEITFKELIQKDSPHLISHIDSLTTLVERYTTYKKQQNLLDYDDLLFEFELLLKGDESKNIPPLAPLFQERYQYIMVDEYQDTNRVQARLVRLLSGNTNNTMAVGDDAQSIYAFRGATVNNILEFPNLFPGTKIIRLEENYRSTQPILDIANAILKESQEGFHKHLFTNRIGGEKVRLIRSLSDLTQANLIANRIKELLSIYPPKEIAILFRAGYQSYHLEIALAKHTIRFRKYGGLKYTEAAHIKDMMAFIRLIVNPLDMPSFLRIAAFSKGVGPKTAQKIYQIAAQGNFLELQKVCNKYPDLLSDMTLLDEIRQQPLEPTEILTKVFEHYQPKLIVHFPEDWPRRQQGLEELIHIASAYTDLEQFIADLSLETPEEELNEEESIVLSTIHSAKGLEWDAVIILDLVEDRFPSRHSLIRSEDFEEERRLMYVACTRAKKQLELSVPTTLYNKQYGCNEPAIPSPFVQQLPSIVIEEWQEGYSGNIYKKITIPTNQPDSKTCSQIPASNNTYNKEELSYSFCRHKIFGRGKIIEYLLPDKCRVNFPGFGLKVILKDYLTIED